MRTKFEEFYVIVDKRNLEFVKDEYCNTRNIDKAKQFNSKEEALQELFMFDDDIRQNFNIYKANRETAIFFELVNEE